MEKNFEPQLMSRFRLDNPKFQQPLIFLFFLITYTAILCFIFCKRNLPLSGKISLARCSYPYSTHGLVPAFFLLPQRLGGFRCVHLPWLCKFGRYLGLLYLFTTGLRGWSGCELL